jgi:FkbM family methyltransferase
VYKLNDIDVKFVNISNKIWDTISNFHKCQNVSIFGAGSFGIEVSNKLKQRGYTIECFFDNDKKLHNSIINEIKVLSPDKIDKSVTGLIIASTWYFDIIKQLKANNTSFQGSILIIDPWQNILDVNINKTDSFLFDFFYSKLRDDLSKETLVNILQSRISTTSINESSYKQYFHPNVKIEDNDVFIDGGAFTGDTLIEINKKENLNLEVHCFEPDDINFDKLLQESHLSKNKVVCNKLGLWDKDETLKFMSSAETCDLSCKIEDEGDILIETISIDSYCSQNNIKPTFIKLDVEGAEKKVLEGSKNIIKKYKPKLAIALYHKYDDLWTIPYLINQIESNYSFYLGHHSDRWYETILYASIEGN